MTKTQLTHFDRYRGEAATRSGLASYIDTGGEGPPPCSSMALGPAATCGAM